MGRATAPPYLGVETFGFEHRALFFGRDAEGRSVASMVAVHPLSVLTGASGTGKSSLLAAMVQPTLAARGWFPVLAQPAEDPLAALRREALAQAVPDPAGEVATLDALSAAMGNGAGDRTLAAARRWYAGLGGASAERLSIDRAGLDPAAKIAHHALLARLLADSCAAAPARAMLAALAGLPPAAEPTLGALRRGLAEGGAAAAAEWRARLGFGGPVLGRLLLRIWRLWLAPQGWKGLALVLDQAEEVFTRFRPAAPGPAVGAGGGTAAAPGVEPRRRLFAALPLLVGLGRRHPLRLCVSLRPEWYASLLAALGPLAPSDPGAVHLLQPLRPDQARQALRGPAEVAGDDFDGAAGATILARLDAETEGQGIDPFLLAVVARLVWEFAGEAAGGADGSEAGAAPRRVTPAEVARLVAGPSPAGGPGAARAGGGLVDGALDWLMQRSLRGLAPERRADLLEMLGHLVTAEGTRKIVAETDLLRQPLRRFERLLETLEALGERRLVRRTGEGRAAACEIRHERLIAPLQRWREADRRAEFQAATGGAGEPRAPRARLGEALDLLAALPGPRLDRALADGLEEDPLPGWARDCLLANRGAVGWDPPAARAVLASLLHRGAPEALAGRAAQARREYLRAAFHDLLPGLDAPVPEHAPPGEVAQRLCRGQGVSADAAPLFRARQGSLPAEARWALWRRALQAGGALPREDIEGWTEWATNGGP